MYNINAVFAGVIFNLKYVYNINNGLRSLYRIWNTHLAYGAHKGTRAGAAGPQRGSNASTARAQRGHSRMGPPLKSSWTLILWRSTFGELSGDQATGFLRSSLYV